MADPLIVDFDHHAGGFLADRLSGWRTMRATPVAYTPCHGGFWVVSGYDQVAQVSRDEATFSSLFGDLGGVRCRGIAGVPRPRGIPPAGIAEAEARMHQNLRRVLTPYLMPPAVEALRPLAGALTTWFLDERVASGRMDLVADLTNPVPAIVTMRLVGLPVEDWRYYAELFHATVAYRPGSDEHNAALSGVPEMMASLLAEVRSRRSRPRDDMLSALVAVRDGDGRRLDDETVGSVLWNLVGGGLDTTTSLTSLSLFHLGAHPEQRRRLVENPGLIPVATEEFLRYFSVNETLTRTVTCETTLAGQKLSPGDVVLLSWLSANHDEGVFPRSDEVVLDRAPNRHLAFGVGAHRCIGMHVARALFQTMVSGVLARIPDYRIDLDATRFYEGNPMLAGAVCMPVTFTPGARTGPAAPPLALG